MDFFLFQISVFAFCIDTITNHPLQYNERKSASDIMLEKMGYKKWGELSADDKTLAFADLVMRCNEAEKYKTLLTVRSRIEYLEKRLVPPGMNPRSRFERWVRILHSGTPDAEQILKHVLEEYGSTNKEASIKMFAEAMRDIYGDISDKGAHNVLDPYILDELKTGTDSTIKRVLDLLEAYSDENLVKALRIVSIPLKVEKEHQPSEATYSKFTCVVISSPTGYFPAGITEEHVREFFPLNAPISVAIKTEKTASQHEIEAQFVNNNAAVEAYNNNHGWLKKVKVQLRLSSTCK